MGNILQFVEKGKILHLVPPASICNTHIHGWFDCEDVCVCVGGLSIYLLTRFTFFHPDTKGGCHFPHLEVRIWGLRGGVALCLGVAQSMWSCVPHVSKPTSDPTSECHLRLRLPRWGAKPRVPITQDLRMSTQGVATQGFSFQSVFVKASR